MNISSNIILPKVAAVLLLGIVSCAKPSATPLPAPENITAIEFAESMGLGWNLGNSLDAQMNGVSNETCWGNGKATQQTFDAIKAMGFGCVRIPVTWMGHIGPAPEYKVEKAWLDRVAEVAGYAKKAGLKAIINVHHDGADSKYWLSLKAAAQSEAADAQIRKQYGALWSQIATHFKDEGDWLIFETMNEVHDGDWGNGNNLYDAGLQYRIISGWNQVAVDAIRKAGGKNLERFIAVTGIAANIGLTANNLILPSDSVKDRLIVAVHSYDPWEYAGLGKYDEWGHTGSDGRMAPKSRELDYTISLDILVNKFIKKGIPVYMGECGCVHRSAARAEKFRKYYLEYTFKAMRERNIVPMVWDNGATGTGEESFGLVNHATGGYINNAKEIIDIMVNAYTNTNPAYTLSSVYDKAPL